jgi:outer membrane biosynthesis protein TonB
VPRKEKGPLPTLLGILLVIALLVGGAIWMVIFAVQQWRASGDEAVAAPAVTAAPVDASAPVEAPAPAPVEPVEEKATPPTLAKPAEPAPPVEPAPVETEPAPPPPKKPDVEPTEPPEPAPAPAPEPAKPKAPVAWPSLALQGVIGKGQNGSAIINDQVLAVNETIEDVRVLAVGRQNVELEYNGERRTLKVGMTTR